MRKFLDLNGIEILLDGDIMKINNEFKNLTFDEERALYGIKDARVEGCKFDGPVDGESALKECADLEVVDCDFRLRYPLWHTTNADITGCVMTETCRAALWYDKNVSIRDSRLGGIKALRECDKSYIENCEIDSVEFGWICRDTEVKNSSLKSEYPFFQCRNLTIDGLKMSGKYSFQYVENVNITNSVLNTKDAFWHGKNIVVTDSIVKGEYLAWYSDNIKFVRCQIIGTQPLCYAKNLVLEDCEMIDCDLSFERSDVIADIKGGITSVKDPVSGRIKADSIGEIILDEYMGRTSCEIITG